MPNNKIFFWSLTVALAGFLFGFDTVVISGADQSLEALWSRGDFFHGVVIMASALWGTVLGAIFGGIPTDKIGRKQTLFLIGALYFISAVGSGMAGDPWVFAAFRFIGGLGVGASTIAAPAYISEIAPANDRGKLVALYQFNIVFGILVAFLSNYLLSGLGESAWRWMIGVEAIPALIYTLMVLTVPKSPRWLLNKGREGEAREVLERIQRSSSPPEDAGAVAGAMIDSWKAEWKTSALHETIFSTSYRFPLSLAFLIAVFNQFSGINAF
jgi:MFS family permease